MLLAARPLAVWGTAVSRALSAGHYARFAMAIAACISRRNANTDAACASCHSPAEPPPRAGPPMYSRTMGLARDPDITETDPCAVGFATGSTKPKQPDTGSASLPPLSAPDMDRPDPVGRFHAILAGSGVMCLTTMWKLCLDNHDGASQTNHLYHNRVRLSTSTMLRQ